MFKDPLTQCKISTIPQFQEFHRSNFVADSNINIEIVFLHIHNCIIFAICENRFFQVRTVNYYVVFFIEGGWWQIKNNNCWQQYIAILAEEDNKSGWVPVYAPFQYVGWVLSLDTDTHYTIPEKTFINLRLTNDTLPFPTQKYRSSQRIIKLKS